MTLTKDELLEMINSTISSNGTKAITGDALNAALTALAEASQPTYEFPEGIWAASYDNKYTFTEAESAAFRKAWENRATTRFIAIGNRGGLEFRAECSGYYDAGHSEYAFGGGGGQSFWDNIMYDLYIEDNDGVLRAYCG